MQYTHKLQIPEHVMAKCLFSNLLFRTGYDVKVNNLNCSRSTLFYTFSLMGL